MKHWLIFGFVLLAFSDKQPPAAYENVDIYGKGESLYSNLIVGNWLSQSLTVTSNYLTDSAFNFVILVDDYVLIQSTKYLD